jgi:hypothetical protein
MQEACRQLGVAAKMLRRGGNGEAGGLVRLELIP